MKITSIILILIIIIISIFLLPVQKLEIIKFVSFLGSSIVLILSTSLLLDFNSNNSYFQHVVTYHFGVDYLNIFLVLGLDGISIFFFLLSSLLIFLCFLFIWNEPLFKTYALNLLLINLLLLFVFSVLDIFLFYIFFEAILFPMFLIIGLWGSRERKIRAVYLFFFYTLVGSLCMLVGVFYIYNEMGSVNFEYLLTCSFTDTEQYYLWAAFFLSFAAKIPLFPFHIWLPEAHVEAPTVGSVLLAGILLKLGVYGFLRFSLTLFPLASLYFSPLVYLLGILGIIYASFTAIRQTDLKRIIAYSSVAHMNLVMLGLFSFNLLGIEGAILQSISHGFVASGMFFLIGILYERYHTRFLYYYGGLVHMMPLYAFFFLVFTLANIALPGTSSFVGEFLLLSGIFKVSFVCTFMGLLGVIICGGYSLWLYNRIMFGNLKIYNTILYQDINFREFSILIILLFFVFFLGIYPQFVINYINCSSLALIQLL